MKSLVDATDGAQVVSYVMKDSGKNYDEEVWGEGASLSYPSSLRLGERCAICFFDREGKV